MNIMSLLQQINQLKQQYSDPNQAIQQLLNSGKVSQEQYNRAVQQAQQLFNSQSKFGAQNFVNNK